MSYEFTVDQELRASWGVPYVDFVEQILDFAGIGDQGQVLDIATGTGLIPRTLVAKYGFGGHIVGLDFTFAALSLGKQKVLENQKRMAVTHTCASAVALPFAAGSFDCVICALATHHIPQKQLFDQVASVLKPGGLFVLADVLASPSWRVPGVRFFLRLLAFVYFLFAVSPARAWVESDAVSHVYTEEEWKSAFQQHGFSQVVFSTPSIRRTWAPSAFLIKATKDVS